MLKKLLSQQVLTGVALGVVGTLAYQHFTKREATSNAGGVCWCGGQWPACDPCNKPVPDDQKPQKMAGTTTSRLRY